MKRKNLLLGVAGVFIGCIIGFLFANQINRNAANSTFSTAANQPDVSPGHSDLNNGGAIPQVQAVIEKAEAEPDNFEAQTKAAGMFYQIRRFDRAIEFLKRANNLKPDDYGTLVNLGNSCFDSNQFEEAEKWYASALAHNADDANVRTDLGLTFLLRQKPDYDRAILELNRSLKKDAKHPQALQNLTIAYTKKGEAVRAKESLSRLESLDATNPALTKLREDIQKLESK